MREYIDSFRYFLKEDIGDELFIEGRKYFPKLKKIDDRYYLNFPKNGGSFSWNGFKNHLINHKIRKIMEIIKEYIINDNYSNTTQSVYFKMNGKDYRISDHKRGSFDGIDIIIGWKTSIEDVVNNILNK